MSSKGSNITSKVANFSETIDGIRVGKFPDNDDLKVTYCIKFINYASRNINFTFQCYVNCVMELMTIIRNGVPNFDLTVKQMNVMLPEELREPYINGVNACRNAGILKLK